MKVIHHGGKDTITGSCHELRADETSILIDCGLFQGADERALEIEFATEHLNALLLTHSHIDHVGRIPWLLASGFTQPIYCTEATAELVPLMLEDGLKLQLGLSTKQTQQVMSRLKAQLRPQSYAQWFSLPSNGKPTLKARFQHAGHILGSAYIEILLPNQEVVVFSGDLGPKNTPLLPDPIPPKRADYLFIESTYCRKHHDDIHTRSQRLLAIIERSLADGGAILIPAFSVGRTQELLFDIEQLIHQNKISTNLPIILDSPMAQQVTQSYRRFKTLWGQEAKARLAEHRHPLAFEQCITIDDHRNHKRLVNRLASTGEAAIVVAASGMCQGGRIMNYLQALLPDERTDVLLAGYQAQGTLGRAIQNGDKQVSIEGKEIEVKAQVHTMSGYSAHADKADLFDFIHGISPPPKEIHLIHGESDNKKEWAKELNSKGHHCVIR
ncbi:MBL fold metallo-hydrolase RNA specificity domain-containing protein [Vibrio renipiscarius]|uniref:MBL fold metallo-hydrolase RNA specificity domain-containing protein n=1 Tax=Vibrio renipiscarius TaxID=1461322 RepID=UPI00354B6189